MPAAQKKDAERWYTIAEAAALASVSDDYIRKAMNRTEPPMLVAKNIGLGKRPSYRISATELDAFFDGLPDG